MSRINTHVMETESRHIFAKALTEFLNDTVRKGDLLFRELSERDYGIDGEVELFDQGLATGRFAKVQLRTRTPLRKCKGNIKRI